MVLRTPTSRISMKLTLKIKQKGGNLNIEKVGSQKCKKEENF